MKLSKKILEKGRRKFQKDLFYGRKSFRFLKEVTNRWLQDASEAWQNMPKPITKKDKETRELIVGLGSLGSVFLKRIREAEAYRKSIKFRNCRYKKYEDQTKRIIFKCSFLKLSENSYKTNYLILRQSNKGRFSTQLIKNKIEINSQVIEEGRFKFLPHFFDEFNIFFYPNNGLRYGYKFKGKSNDALKAIKIGL